MALRLLPAFGMDNDEDDDGNFTKWMSSYWGHGAEAGHSRERKRSFRRPAKTGGDRRASLPTVSQLDTMHLHRLHAAALASAPGHSKPREEKGDGRPHQRARRVSSDDGHSHSRTSIPEIHPRDRITTIPELTESFERRLYFRDKKIMSTDEDDKVCLICHENMRKSGGGVQELHCTHRFHKEAARRSDQCRPHSGSEAAACQVRRPLSARRKSTDAPISTGEIQEKEEHHQHTHRRQLSLRKHR